MEPMDDRYNMLQLLMKFLENIWCCMLMYIFLLSDEISVVIEKFLIKEFLLQRLDLFMEVCDLNFEIIHKT